MPTSEPFSASGTSLGGAMCVVTGGLGFIGSNLVHRLCALGAAVRVIDAHVPDHGGDPRNLDGLSGVEVLMADIGNEQVGPMPTSCSTSPGR